MAEVSQDVRVLGVVVAGHDVLVDVYGGSSNVCGSVRYTFPDRRVRAAQVDRLRRWAGDDQPLTLVVDDTSIALIDDRHLVDRALDLTD